MCVGVSLIAGFLDELVSKCLRRSKRCVCVAPGNTGNGRCFSALSVILQKARTWLGAHLHSYFTRIHTESVPPEVDVVLTAVALGC